MLFNNFTILADAGVWYAFANSDAMGKGIVFLLFISSMVAWFIMIEKGLALYRAQKLSERFAATFDKQHGMNSMLRGSMDNPCPVAKVYASGMEQLLEFYGQTIEEASSNAPVRDGHGPRKLSPAQLDAVQTAMEREISGQIFVIEERIGMLATAVSLAPFLGLFGTVWGVMIAFCGVASAGSANIQALAPGVAGALLTTVAGLVVAIPSLVGYNFLTQMIRKITVSMDNFSESFMARLKLEQLTAKDILSAEKRQTQPAAAVSNPAAASQAAAGRSYSNPAQQTVQYQQPQQNVYQPDPAQQTIQYQQPQQNVYQPDPAQRSVQYQQPNTYQQQSVQYQQPQQSVYQQPAPMPSVPEAAPSQMSFSNMGQDPENSMRS